MQILVRISSDPISKHNIGIAVSEKHVFNVQDQDEKLERALDRLARLKAGDGAAVVADVHVALLREGNRSMLHELHQLGLDFPSAGIAAALEAAGISLPPGTSLLGRSGSRAMSRSGSEHSSRPGSTASLGQR